MVDQPKTPTEQAFDEAAKRWFKVQDQADHEKRMQLFRAGKLSAVETEQIIAEEVARGDAQRRAEAERAAKELNELGAKLRGY